MKNNNVLAVVNGKEITQEDVTRFLKEVGPQVARQFQSPEGMERVLEELIGQELLYLEALENKLNEDADFISLLENTKELLLKNYAVSKLISNENASEIEMKKYYNEHKEQYIKPESLLASHILVDTKEKASMIIKELEKGLTFEEAAKRYSSCPSKENGGSLGEFTRGQMVAEFENAAFAMEKGTVSEPVQSQYGYHIIKLVDRIPSGLQKFDDVKNDIHQNLVRSKQQKKYLDKIEELKQKYEVQRLKK